MVNNNPQSRVNPRIQYLRAIAVILVVTAHAYGGALPHGVLGVDVFFVISGFVILKSLFENSQGNYIRDVLSFFQRRFARILPLVILVVTISSLTVALVFVRPDNEYSETAIASLLGIANIALLRQGSAYGGLDAQLNPFTHFWSLGVEEQFYFFFPWLVLAVLFRASNPTSQLLRLAIPLVAVSFGIYSLLIFLERDSMAFYLLPTRAWQLGLGAIVYLVGRSGFQGRQHHRWASAATGLGVLLLVTSQLLPVGFSDTSRISATLSAALLLLAWAVPLRHNKMPIENSLLGFSGRGLARIGTYSFSIYLWHWPILVVGRYVLGPGFERVLPIALVGLLLLSSVSYHFFENPLRKLLSGSSLRKGLAIPLVSLAVSLPLVVLIPSTMSSDGSWLARSLGVPPTEPRPEWRCHGLEGVPPTVDPMSYCLGNYAGARGSRDQNAYVLGDSHAMHLLPMVEAAVGPEGYEIFHWNPETEQGFPWSHFKSAGTAAPPELDYLLSISRPGDLVIMSFHRGHLNPERDAHVSLGEAHDRTELVSNLKTSLISSAQSLQTRGVKLVLVLDTPLLNSVSLPESCALQSHLFGENSCRVSLAQDLHTRALQEEVFIFVERAEENVLVFDPAPYLYIDDHFDIFNAKGNYTMRDWHHISRETAISLAAPFRDLLTAHE